MSISLTLNWPLYWAKLQPALYICTHMEIRNVHLFHNYLAALCIISKISTALRPATLDLNSVVPNPVTEIPRSVAVLDTRIPSTSCQCTTSKKFHMLHALFTRCVILPDLFQLYKAARICHLHSFHDGITTACYTQRALHLRRSSLRSQQGPATPRLLPERKKSVYVSVGFYPVHNYQKLVDFGGLEIKRSSCLQNMSTLWSTECQDSWKQCVGTKICV